MPTSLWAGTSESPTGRGRRRTRVPPQNLGQSLQALVPGEKASLDLSPEGSTAQLLALPDGSVLAAWERQGGLEFRLLP